MPVFDCSATDAVWLFPSLAQSYRYRPAGHHPNLRDAHQAAETAIKHVQEAQAANKGIEFGGHAEKAIELFKHAQQELVEADKYNEMHQKK